MLKKIARHGNSAAIVLDKPILELLNITDGATVKLTTDGKSLIITPVDSNASDKVSMTGEETLRAVVNDMVKEGLAKSPMPNAELFQEVSKAMGALQEKYRTHIESMMHNPEFYKKLEELKHELETTQDKELYLHKAVQLRHKHFPQIKKYDEEMMALGQRLQVTQKDS